MYAYEITETSKSALLELGLSLKQYHNDMVLSGGWAPYFITQDFFEHCGSIDIDLVLRTKIMPRYESIRKTAVGLGYSAENEFRFNRIIRSHVDNRDYEIHLDFLCDKIGTEDLLKVQPDLEAFMFPGMDIAFDFNFEQEIEAVLPGNGSAITTFKVLDLVGSLALKGQALNGRFKQKDAYDVFALTHLDDGPENAAKYFNRAVSGAKISTEKQKLLAHSVSVIREKFKDPSQVGPFQVESFTDGKFRRSVVAAQVNQFLDGLNVPFFK
ncbi:MAG: hypothetical protein PHS02_01775 [Candidatus ainarchaeum sp.]|nr:hypothetical protein [Candidatus ainarchaeum sp.]